jgi:septum formation protein
MSALITLASTSAIRRTLLTGAGLTYEAVSPGVDEDAAKEGMRAAGASPRDQADALAEMKAIRVSQKRPGFVIGCDQMMAFEGNALDKCATLDEARDRLRRPCVARPMPLNVQQSLPAMVPRSGALYGPAS